MALTNSLANIQAQQEKPSFSKFLIPKKNNIMEILGKERTLRFYSSIVSAIGTNPALNGCEYGSLLSGALLGESLGLAHSPQLGQYYLVPFKKRFKDKDGNWKEITQAQFILGVKGWKQLAIRSGQYRTINVIPVKQGEYKGRDKWSGEPCFEFIESDEERNSLPVVGYMAYFELLNGFSKVLYRSKDEMLKHADRYSPAFSLYGEKTKKYTKVSYEDYIKGNYNKDDEYLYSSFWYKDFDGMACGKVLKKLIQEYGVLSVDLENAMDKDDKIIEDYEKNVYGEVEITAVEPKNDNESEIAEDGEEVAEEKEELATKPNKAVGKAKKNESGAEVVTQNSFEEEFFQ